jgi:hypothetical protein
VSPPSLLASTTRALNLNTRHYSLEIVQHPIRARMCGFGDKVCPIPYTLGSNALVRVGSAASRPRGGRKARRSERR